MIPKISIIIASFNAEKFISAALNSVLAQSLVDWECIVIDGASTDNTVSILKNYSSLDNRIRFVSEKDNGIYYAFNKGLSLARGEWIYYLGCDDLLYSEALKSLISESSTFDVVYGNTTLNFGGYKRLQISQSFNTLPRRMCCCHQSIIVKRTVMNNLGGFNTNYRICSDFDLIQRAYLSGYKFKQTNILVSIYSVMGLSSDNFNTEYEVYKVCKNNHSTKFVFMVLLLGTIKCMKNKIIHYIFKKI